MDEIRRNKLHEYNVYINRLLDEIQDRYDNGTIYNNLIELQNELSTLSEKYHPYINQNKIGYKIYEAKAYLQYFNGQYDAALASITHAENVRGETFKGAEELISLIHTYSENTNPEETNIDIANEYFISKWPSWLRWVLVIPASLLGSVVVSTFVNIFNGIISGGELEHIWSEIISSFVLGFVFVYFAAAVAPKVQFEISVIFLVILALLSGMLWMSGTDSGLYIKTTNELYYAFYFLLSIAGGIGGLFSVKSKIAELSK